MKKPPIKTTKMINALDLRNFLQEKYSSEIWEENDDGIWGDLFGEAVANDSAYGIDLSHDDSEMHNKIIDKILLEYPELSPDESIMMWVCW